MEKLRKIDFYHHNEDLSCCYESLVPVYRAKDAKSREYSEPGLHFFPVCQPLCVNFYRSVLPRWAAVTTCHQTFGSVSHPVSPIPDFTPKLIAPTTSTSSCHSGAQNYTWFSKWEHRFSDNLSERSARRDPKPAQPHHTLLGISATPVPCVPFCLDNVLQKQLRAY